MKKGLITLAVILALVMTMAIMAPAFAKANDFDCLIVSPKMQGVDVTWAGQTADTGALFEGYNAGAIELTEDGYVKYSLATNPLYMQLYPYKDEYKASSDVYPYFCVSIKIEGAADVVKLTIEEGVEGDPETGTTDGFIKKIGMLPASSGLDFIMAGDKNVNLKKTNVKLADYTGGTLDGVVAYVEYFGYFKTEADAQAFDYAAWLEANKANLKGDNAPESSAPESSTPESSTPESSTPESSTPESSKPESSKPESSKPSADTGHGTLVSGAVMVFAAAAAVVVLSKKR